MKTVLADINHGLFRNCYLQVVFVVVVGLVSSSNGILDLTSYAISKIAYEIVSSSGRVLAATVGTMVYRLSFNGVKLTKQTDL